MLCSKEKTKNIVSAVRRSCRLNLRCAYGSGPIIMTTLTISQTNTPHTHTHHPTPTGIATQYLKEAAICSFKEELSNVFVLEIRFKH